MKIIRLLLTLAFGSVIGFFLCQLLPRNSPFAYVLVTNNASSTAQTVRIESKGGEIYLLENLEVGASKPVRLCTYGESGYMVKVVFANGKTLQDEQYIESGYKLVERLTDDKIEPEYNLKGAY